MTNKMNDVKQLNYNALMVLQCLFENTDQYRHLSIKKIEETIRNKYGYGPTHNTINKILNYLPDYGFDVRKGSKANSGFYLNARYFTNGEILYIIETLNKTRSMADTDRVRLTSKLSSYLGPEFENMEKGRRVRKDSQTTGKIETIEKAIKEDRQIWFDYASRKGDKPIRVQANPYKLLYGRGSVRLLYGSLDRDDECYLYIASLSNMDKLYVDPQYRIVPLYKAKNSQKINDEFLMESPSGKITEESFHYIILKLKGLPLDFKRYAKTVIGGKVYKVDLDTRSIYLDLIFGLNNVTVFEEAGTQYALVMGSSFKKKILDLLHSSSVSATVIWPEEAVNWVKGVIMKSYNEYFPENMADSRDETVISENIEGGCLDPEKDAVEQARTIVKGL